MLNNFLNFDQNQVGTFCFLKPPNFPARIKNKKSISFFGILNFTLSKLVFKYRTTGTKRAEYTTQFNIRYLNQQMEVGYGEMNDSNSTLHLSVLGTKHGGHHIDCENYFNEILRKLRCTVKVALAENPHHVSI